VTNLSFLQVLILNELRSVSIERQLFANIAIMSFARLTLREALLHDHEERQKTMERIFGRTLEQKEASLHFLQRINLLFFFAT